MSKHQSQEKQPLTKAAIQKLKQSGEKIAVVTCYDAAFARLINRTKIDMVLVGDSLGNVVLGYENTIPVIMDDMVYHTRSVARTLKGPFLIADMPFGSYLTPDDAARNAVTLVQQGGAHAVKLEGGRSMTMQVRRITEAGIPVVGHLGLTPQSLHALSGYRVQGREAAAARALLDDAQALEQAGAMALVLELIPEPLAQEVTSSLHIPTIGIGAGRGCDGQVLVLHDLLGFDDGFKPKFLKQYANIGQKVIEALDGYTREVKSREFPADEHSFS